MSLRGIGRRILDILRVIISLNYLLDRLAEFSDATIRENSLPKFFQSFEPLNIIFCVDELLYVSSAWLRISD